MVQRKVPSNKLGIQAGDHVNKSENRLGNLKPSFYQQQDSTRGPDLKKKMKKSRSFKFSDLESKRSSSTTVKKKSISLPGKPPPASVATPQKQQSPAKAIDSSSPNYMKSTSSSEARKEHKLVSSPKTRTASSDSKSLHQQRNLKTSKFGSASSGGKPARALTRSSSLKLVRTLTKTPSFKKCSRVVLCADVSAQRATCSSTLKEAKFPPYLMLNPGGTEAQGTTVMKVCPYTYCSLNGHHHPPLPPLKCFLSARRRSLKTQKSFKLGALSPRKAKLIGNRTKEINSSEAFDETPTSPLIQEVGIDFFIEIYAKSKEDHADAAGKIVHTDDEKINDSAKEVDEAPLHQNSDKQVAVSLSDGSPKSEIDFEENFEKYGDFMSIEIETPKGFSEEQRVEDANEDCLPVSAQEELTTGCLYNESDAEADRASVEEADNFSEATDMEWEEGKFSGPEPPSKTACLIKDDHEPMIKNGDLRIEYVIRTDDIISINNGKIPADEGLLEILEEESECSDATKDSDFKMDGATEDGEVFDSSLVSESFSYDQLSSKDAFEESVTEEEKDEETEGELTSTITTSASTEELIIESAAASEEIQESGVGEAENEISDAENSCSIDIAAEASNDPDEDISIQDDDAGMQLQNQIPDSSETEKFESVEDHNRRGCQTESETDRNATSSNFGLQKVLLDDEDGDEIEDALVVGHRTAQSFQLDENTAAGTVDESLPAETEDNPSDVQNGSFNDDGNQNISKKNEDRSKKRKTPSSMDSEEQSGIRLRKIKLADKSNAEVDATEVNDNSKTDAAEMYPATKDAVRPTSGRKFLYTRRNSNKELPEPCNTQKWTIGCRRSLAEDTEESRKFNPREPNYLPLIPEPDGEKVDLKHQMTDERKNAEEWMLDYALQQAVSKLAPARKKKVALLVEAFEKVMPVSKFDTNLRQAPSGFAHSRPIQACS